MRNSKACFKCNVQKPLNLFYKHSGMADGRLNKCIECNKKDTKENTIKNHDYYLEYDRNRANLPHRIEARLKYSQTNEGKEVARRAKDKWAVDNVIKRGASHIVNNSIRDGKLIKEYKCQECGTDKGRIHGHHDDYAYPLSVRWLCSKCHCAWHKINGSGING
jgi:hypothetical protein